MAEPGQQPLAHVKERARIHSRPPKIGASLSGGGSDRFGVDFWRERHRLLFGTESLCKQGPD